MHFFFYFPYFHIEEIQNPKTPQGFEKWHSPGSNHKKYQQEYMSKTFRINQKAMTVRYHKTHNCCTIKTNHSG